MASVVLAVVVTVAATIVFAGSVAGLVACLIWQVRGDRSREQDAVAEEEALRRRADDPGHWWTP